jgi:hypothetical protein
MGRNNTGDIPPTKKAPAKQGRGSGRGEDLKEELGKLGDAGLYATTALVEVWIYPAVLSPTKTRIAWRTPVRKMKQVNHAKAAGEVVAIEVPVAMWVSLVLDFQQRFSSNFP